MYKKEQRNIVFVLFLCKTPSAVNKYNLFNFLIQYEPPDLLNIHLQDEKYLHNGQAAAKDGAALSHYVRLL